MTKDNVFFFFFFFSEMPLMIIGITLICETVGKKL